jgi:DNA end-binding protein Ku
MAARAIWKGIIKVGAERVPIKLYSAVEDRTVRFNVLEKSTMTRITQHMVNPESGEEVPNDHIQKAYEVEPGIYVRLTNEDLEKAKPEESRDIEIMRFVSASHIDQQWYDRPHYLGPDESDAASYFALAAALENEKREGIARWTMRNIRYVGALRSQGGYLMLITLKFAEEVLSADELPQPAGRPPDAKELKMAEQLVQALEDEFRPQDYHDEYRERVMKFIEAKAKGLKPKLRIVARKKETTSLADTLAASLKAVKRDKERAVA